MAYRVIESSLEFDTTVADYATREAAALAVRRVLTFHGGWPITRANDVLAEGGGPFLVADDGDDWNIVIQKN